MGKLTTSFCGVRFSTPLICPSGIVVEPERLLKLASHPGVGGVTTKSISLQPRRGHPFPRIISFGIGFINSVGLENPGVKQAKKEIRQIKRKVKKPLIASIFAAQLSQFPVLAAQIAQAKPDFIELNLSCPNVDDEFGKPFATDPLLSAIAVLEVKKAVKNIPIIAKLTPNTPDIKRVAFEVAKAGADAIAAINTVGPGLLIDWRKKKPLLGHRVGGVSGPAIKPIALRCVNEIAKTVDLPIIGMGGVATAEDALEMIMAGATLVGIGSAVFSRGFQVFDQIAERMRLLLRKENLGSLSQIRGVI